MITFIIIVLLIYAVILFSLMHDTSAVIKAVNASLDENDALRSQIINLKNVICEFDNRSSGVHKKK